MPVYIYEHVGVLLYKWREKAQQTVLQFLCKAIIMLMLMMTKAGESCGKVLQWLNVERWQKSEVCVIK